MSLKLGGIVVLAFVFGDSLTVYPSRVCLGLAISGIVFFDLTIDGINFWRLTGSGADLQYCSLFLLPSLELTTLKTSALLHLTIKLYQT